MSFWRVKLDLNSMGPLKLKTCLNSATKTMDKYNIHHGEECFFLGRGNPRLFNSCVWFQCSGESRVINRNSAQNSKGPFRCGCVISQQLHTCKSPHQPLWCSHGWQEVAAKQVKIIIPVQSNEIQPKQKILKMDEIISLVLWKLCDTLVCFYSLLWNHKSLSFHHSPEMLVSFSDTLMLAGENSWKRQHLETVPSKLG